MLVAYMDESGSHAGSHASLVAGYWGSVNEWRRFERRWKDALDEFSITEFHAKDFWTKGQGTGEFRNWTEERRELLLRKLVGIIEAAKIYPFACGVLRSEWDKLTPQERKLYTGGTQPHLSGCPSKRHFWGFQVSVIRAALYCEPHLGIDYVLDFDRNSAGWATKCFRQLKKDAQNNNDAVGKVIGDLTFEDSKSVLPLQAADLLAYEAARYAKGAYGGNRDPKKMNVLYARVVSRMRSKEDFWLFDKIRIANWKARLGVTSQS